MKGIISIIRLDAKRITASVVSIITILGLCIIPCLYAWFNIFSNWAPYDSDATGRIAVAVVSEDAGVDLLGVKLNVGDKVISALEANDAIGWVFVDDSAAALEGVNAGDYYAALVIPKDFSEDAVSFLGGTLTNPRILYYENEKKNAIAPKITGKAKTAVQEQINATFVQTLASYISGAVSIAERTGNDPQAVFTDLRDKANDLDEKLDGCVVMLDAAAGLSGAAEQLFVLTDLLVTDTESSIQSGQSLVSSAGNTLSTSGNLVESSADALRQTVAQLESGIDGLLSELERVFTTAERFNSFVDNDLAARKTAVDTMRQSCQTTANSLDQLGLTQLAERFSGAAAKLQALSDKLDSLEVSDADEFDAVRASYDALRDDLSGAQAEISAAEALLTDALAVKLQDTIDAAQTATAQLQQSLSAFGGDLAGLSVLLNQYSSALGALEDGLSGSRAALQTTHDTLHLIIAVLDRLAGSESLTAATTALSGDSESLAAYFASPVQMRTEVLYPVREYGSAMAPFYTVLAQWVGALLAVVLIKTQIKPNATLGKLRLYERFFGRYGLLLFVGLAQGLIVSLGDVIYIGIQCPHPFLFVLAACVNGLVFSLINYALVFALDNIGLALGVIILVVQVAGAGGTYPVEVVPKVFRTLYPLMPFRYAMDAMRECVAGMYGNTFWSCEGKLLLCGAAVMLIGLLLYWPALWINRLIAEGKEKTGIML